MGVRAQRDVLGRVVRSLAAGAGVRQFLDIGSGLPTAENVHQIDGEDPATAGLQSAMRRALGPVQFRTRAQIRDLFGGLELAPPGLVLVPQWRPGPGTASEQNWPVLRLACAGIACKP